MTIGKKPLFHFTDTRNLPLIREHGLLSFAELKHRGIANQVITGGDQQSLEDDGKMGLDKYVHLCFFDQHPMEHNKQKEGIIHSSRFLKINPIVLQWEDVKITLAMANKKGTALLTLEQAMEKIDSKIICEWTDWSRQEFQDAKKYEILVPNFIPVEFITWGL
jgi:hypothetical protein